MTRELKCPNCGGTHIVEDEVYDTIDGENNTLRVLCSGHCADCNTDIQYDFVYQFIGYDAIEEI